MLSYSAWPSIIRKGLLSYRFQFSHMSDKQALQNSVYPGVLTACVCMINFFCQTLSLMFVALECTYILHNYFSPCTFSMLHDYMWLLFNFTCTSLRSFLCLFIHVRNDRMIQVHCSVLPLINLVINVCIN